MKSNLFKVDEKEYGVNFKQHLFEQYKIYIESIEEISNRRQHANNYFVTINAALISLIGLLCQFKIIENIFWMKLLIAVVGMMICVIFWFLVHSYKQLNAGKFKVLHEIENLLPLALYQYEWEILGKGENNKIYYPFSHIELFLPWVFGILYIIMGIIIC
jgi:hypothetical protein